MTVTKLARLPPRYQAYLGFKLSLIGLDRTGVELFVQLSALCSVHV